MIVKNISRRKRLAGEQGQSLVLAIIVMFLLVFIGVVFVLLIARNQGRAGRSRDVVEAQYLAEAGIQYADSMLRTSEEGADWRPEPDNMGFKWDETTRKLVPISQQELKDVHDNHPDFKWLRPYAPVDTTVLGVVGAMGPTGGYTSFTTGEGRYLLRVSYNPDTNDPLSKYIKIESIGRIGVVDKDDPTTWGVDTKLRRELTAYKPIGVTDYARFITNKEKRSTDIPLGAAGFDVKYGYWNDQSDYRPSPIRVNGNLMWCGRKIDITLDGKTYDNAGTPSYLPLSMVEVAGDIKQAANPEANDTPAEVWIHEIINGAAPSTYPGYPTSDNNFSTYSGFYRDGSDQSDRDYQTRSIKFLAPPVIDSNNTPTKVPRYIALTRDSGQWITQGNRTVNSGRYGWGRGIYIDNTDDRQPESETLFGGYTPRGDWMKPNNKMSSFWQGPYYVPPGVVITLNPYDTDGDTLPDITITRTDIKSRNRDPLYGKKTVWYDAGGHPMNDKGSTITIPYPQGVQTFTYWNDANGNGVHDSGEDRDITIDRNGVIYAEGNIRIKGMLAEGKQLTVVSGGIIYIEGNILKYRDPKSSKQEPDPTSAISLLAKDYVCVNTTQFVGLLNSLGPTSIGSDAGTGQPPYHLIITPEPATTFFASFSFGPNTGTGGPQNPMLFVRQAGQYGASYINMWLNRRATPDPNDQGLLPIGIDPVTGNVGPLGPYIYGCGDPRYTADAGSGLSSVFDHRVWPLSPQFVGNSLHTAVGIPNFFEIALDQTSYTRNNYLLSAFTIQPLDIRIEAAIYAQNKSFFIIPGHWFNQNAADVPDPATGDRKVRRPLGVDTRWPFFGDPLDIKITIDGAITENLPASVADVSEWYSKWSNIPKTYGSSGDPTAHPGDGLTFLYDPKLGWPVYDNAGTMTPVRTDRYSRALPITPRLPVCEQLYYYGEPT